MIFPALPCDPDLPAASGTPTTSFLRSDGLGAGIVVCGACAGGMVLLALARDGLPKRSEQHRMVRHPTGAVKDASRRDATPSLLMKKAGVNVGRYNMLKLRYITDRADWLLAKAWGLDEEAFEAAGNLRDRMVFGNKE